LTSKRLAAILAALGVAAAVLTGLASARPTASLSGAGSTFVVPLVTAWTQHYHSGSVNYSGIGSGGGISAITARTVDFGASDAPLTSDQASACKDCVQVPWALGATLASYNLKGAPAKLKLSGPVLADIFLGKITHWNDPAIAKLNSGATLPATPIIPVYRSDGSGDTYAFTDFLAKVSPEWKSKLGVSTQVSFPKGIGGKGNDGVAAVVGRQNGSIGYLGISYVFGNQLQYALIQNEAGTYPVPGPDTITAAADSVETIPPDNAISITDPPASASDAYPISTFTYVLFPTTSGKAKTLRDFATYAIGPGQKFGDKLQFAPLPAKVVSAAEQTLARLG
jgi:phosphate transport system substrate-binding protein